MDSQADRYFEDYIVGREEEVGNVSLSENEVYAWQYLMRVKSVCGPL